MKILNRLEEKKIVTSVSKGVYSIGKLKSGSQANVLKQYIGYGKTYIIRGDKTGTVIPNSLLSKMKSGSGKLEFHSHPHNDDCIPSRGDMDLMKSLRKSTGQRISTIVTPNGRTSTFDENGVISTGTVSNTIDEIHRQSLLKLFGGK